VVQVLDLPEGERFNGPVHGILKGRIALYQLLAQ